MVDGMLRGRQICLVGILRTGTGAQVNEFFKDGMFFYYVLYIFIYNYSQKIILFQDHEMLTTLWDEMDSGKFGIKIDTSRMHAVGFSSGGFMTSR